MRKPCVRLIDRGDYYRGEIDMPLEGGGRVVVSQLGDVGAPWDALKRAGAAALRIAQDPALAPLIPPQAMAAALVAHRIAKAAEANLPLLQRASAEMTPAARSLARGVVRAAVKQRRRGLLRLDDDDDDDQEDDDVGNPYGSQGSTFDNRKSATAAQRGARSRRHTGKPRTAKPGRRTKAPGESGPGRSRGQTHYTAEEAAAMGPRPRANEQPPQPLPPPPPGYQYEPDPYGQPMPMPAMPQPYMNAEDPHEQYALHAWGEAAFPQHDEYAAEYSRYADQAAEYDEGMPDWHAQGAYDDGSEARVVVQEDVWDDEES